VFVRTGYHTQVPEISGKLNKKNRLEEIVIVSLFYILFLFYLNLLK
jgi:hypothetical protein